MCQAQCLKTFLFGVCACINFAICLTIVMSLNTLFSDWLTYFQADRGTTSAVQATCVGVTFGAGLLAGMMERKLGERRSLLLGSFLMAVGMLAGSYAPSLPTLILFVGVVTGCGACLLHLSSLSTTLRRFPRRAGFVSSAMSTAASSFHLLTPLLYRLLAEEYTWRGSLLMGSAISLHTAIFALLLTSPLLQPTSESPRIPPSNAKALHPPGDVCLDVSYTVSVHKPDRALEERQSESAGSPDLKQRHSTFPKLDTGCSQVCSDTHLTAIHFTKNGHGKVISSEDGASDPLRTGELTAETKTEGQSLWEEAETGSHPDGCGKDAATTTLLPGTSKRKAFPTQPNCDGEQQEFLQVLPQPEKPRGGGGGVSCEGFCSPLYACVLLVTVVVLSTIFSFMLLVLDFATYRGWTIDEGILLNFIFMLSSLFGRLALGVASLHAGVRPTALMIGGGVIGSAGLCLVEQVQTLWQVAVCYSCMGVSYGVTVGMFPPAVLDITGPRLYPLTLGLVCTFEGILDTAVGILTGVLVDIFQSYKWLSVVYGCLCLLCTLLLLTVFRLRPSCHPPPSPTPSPPHHHNYHHPLPTHQSPCTEEGT